MPSPASLILLAVAAYLLGSIPFSFLVGRHYGVDVRTTGSGNVGATNVMRTAGRTAGVVAFLLDSGKGVLAVLAARGAGQVVAVQAVAAVAAILGHLYPIWLKGRGGKGVATGAGTFLLLAPLPTAVAMGAFAVTLVTVRYVSVASMTGAVLMAALTFVLGSPPPVAWSAAAVAALIVWRHRGNVQLILKGTENRLARKSRES